MKLVLQLTCLAINVFLPLSTLDTAHMRKIPGSPTCTTVRVLELREGGWNKAR